jgi:hypothetical protein
LSFQKINVRFFDIIFLGAWVKGKRRRIEVVKKKSGDVADKELIRQPGFIFEKKNRSSTGAAGTFRLSLAVTPRGLHHCSEISNFSALDIRCSRLSGILTTDV